MAESYVNVVRPLFAAIAKKDLDGALALADPDIRLFAPATGAEAEQPYHLYLGHAGVRKYFAHVGRVWEQLEFRPREFRERDEYVVALGSRVGRMRKGQSVNENTAWATRVKDGRIAWARAYDDPREALRDVPMPCIEIVTKSIERLRNSDLEGAKAFIGPRLEFEAPVTSAARGKDKVYRGYEGMRECLEDVSEVWERIDADIEHYREVGDHVLGIGQLRGRMKDGHEVDTPAQWVWRVDEDLIAWNREYTDVDAALRAVGLTASS